MTRHKAAGQTLVAGELREALRELPYMTPVEVGGEPVYLVETGETVSIGDLPDEDELEELREFILAISNGDHGTKAGIVNKSAALVERFSLSD